jgi:hypothetical protein
LNRTGNPIAGPAARSQPMPMRGVCVAVVMAPPRRQRNRDRLLHRHLNIPRPGTAPARRSPRSIYRHPADSTCTACSRALGDDRRSPRAGASAQDLPRRTTPAAVVAHRVDDAVLLGQPSRPCARQPVAKRLGFADSTEGVSQDGFDQLECAEGHPPIDLDPVPQFRPEVGVKDGLSRPRRPGRRGPVTSPAQVRSRDGARRPK